MSQRTRPDEIRAFVGAVFQPDDWVEIRVIWPKREDNRQAWSVWCRAAALAEDAGLLRRLEKANGEGWGIYVGANPRKASGGGDAASVALARCVFVDFDHVSVESASQTIRDALPTLPAPTLLVDSGHGAHAYWRLDEPMTDLCEWSGIMREMIGLLGTDRVVKDAPRVMRLPGFTNTKAPAMPCRIVDVCAERTYPVVKFPAAAAPQTPPSEPAGDGERRQLSKRTLDFIVNGAKEGERNGRLFSAAADCKGCGYTREEAEAKLIAPATRCGLSDGETLVTIANAWSKDRTSSDPTTQAAAPKFAPIAASDLIRDYPELGAVVIADLLREGETMNVVAAPKIGKSWLVHALAVAVASGKPWLGKATKQGRVLLIDGELHPKTLAKRLSKVQAAMGVSDSDMAMIDVWAVRGQRLTIDMIADALRARPRGEYRLIVVDALYRFLPIGGEENANETMTAIYNTLDSIAGHAGASIAVVHHASKGNQSEKATTDVGSGAGAQSRAADTHLILRPHEEDDHVVVDAAVRSFPPMDSFVIRSIKPGWAVALGMDPTLLRKSGRRGKPAEAETPAREPIRVWTPDDFATEIVGRERSIRDDVIARGVAQGLGKGQAESLLRRAEDAGKVHRHRDSPTAPHRFSIDPPVNLADARQGGGEGSKPPPPPVPSAPGGVGGTRATPLPPSAPPTDAGDDWGDT